MQSIKGFSAHELKASFANNRYHLIMFPTEECNFRCVYCYEDFSIGNMKPWVVEATKSLLSRKIPNLDNLNLSWFGGEPLVAKKTVFDIAEHAYALCEEHGCNLHGDSTTNGMLLDVKTLTRLVSLKQKEFQISIDGAKRTHDTTRLTRNGRGSFDKIWQRMLDAANTDLDFNITLRVHVTAINQDSVREFCELYSEELGGDPRFGLFFKAIEDLSWGKDNKIESLISAGKPRDVARELQQQYAPVGDERPNYICYAAKPNSLVVRANGNLNKCTVALKDDVNHIGKINEDGTLQVNSKKFGTWVEGFSTLDSWQMGCPNDFMQHNHPEKYKSDIPIIEVA